ncbi:MAG: glycosyltransferase family 39 protein [Patescibacteria group bacterium]
MTSFLKRYFSHISLAFILSLYFFFGFQHLEKFITADEHYWIEERIPQYWHAVTNGKWKKTLINDKPGVALALISGPALLFHNDTTLGCQEQDGWFRHCDPEMTSRLYASFRLPILLVNAAFLILIFFSIRAFSDRFVAMAATGLMALSPNLVGMSQIVNPDSLLWSSGSAALFAFLAFLKTGKRSFALWAIVALTLALLSKYTALIIIFFLPFFVLATLFLDPSFSPLSPRKKFSALTGISAIPFFLFLAIVPGVLSSKERITTFLTAGTGSFLPWIGYAILISLLVAVSFFRIPKKLEPVILFSTRFALRMIAIGFFALSVSLVLERAIFPLWDIWNVIPFDIKNLTNARYYLATPLSWLDITFLELSPLIYGLPMATLFFALFVIGFSVLSKTKKNFSIVLIFTFFIVIHLATLGVSNVLAIPRYIILIFPIFALLAAIGMKELWGLLPKKFQTKKYLAIGGTALVLVSLGSLLASKPYYTNFANSLLPEKSLISHSWGYGGYEAAQYLNALPEAKDLTIWSDYYGVCEFFVGRCLTVYTFDPKITPDYYVLTRRGQIRYISKYDRWEEKSGLTAYRYYNRIDPVFGISINGKESNFVKVFRVDKP